MKDKPSKVEAIAGKVMRILEGRHDSWLALWRHGDDGTIGYERKNWISVGELKALAAACLKAPAKRGKR